MTVALREPVHAMSDRLDRLPGTLSGLDDNGLTQTLRDVEVLSRQAQSLMLELFAKADSRAIAVCGQLRVISATISAFPASVPEPARKHIEGDLTGYASNFDLRQLRIIAQRLLARLDPDGPHPARTSPRRHQYAGNSGCVTAATSGWYWRAGRTPSTAGMAHPLIEQLTARRPTTDAGVPGTRTVQQRQADALIGSRSGRKQHEHHPRALGHRIPELTPRHRLPRTQLRCPHPLRATGHGRPRQSPIDTLRLYGRRDITGARRWETRS